MIHLTKPTPCLICCKYMPKGACVEMIVINKHKRYFHVSCFNSLPKQGDKTMLKSFDEMEKEETKICGRCINWRCDNVLHLMGHCIINRLDKPHGTMCNTCTMYKMR